LKSPFASSGVATAIHENDHDQSWSEREFVTRDRLFGAEAT
jgi:hypothetical protein